ncbi:uncharacterized protein BT62DRAFT_926605 [Guyanagaster necrorhizus]|uniref:Uncharacterized protein n=1 Tax=Guyanagaster necrorhizus TaxID=856835 RepID=A0A9P8AWU2_9AGAR|nr:uncharacterized protein BT62DRAFT_926605 [Guyanagaster necrorhizus MCA 3950]KAG7450933.1 hypothetical protein BT62DRAFT_926605 [Guyanagaster necrorhizus MCA 3950]
MVTFVTDIEQGAQPWAISHLAVVDGFERNISAYRIGIDSSIWYQHSVTSKRAGDIGDNPELRILFFRLRRLAESPFVPLFVFSGHERPDRIGIIDAVTLMMSTHWFLGPGPL